MCDPRAIWLPPRACHASPGGMDRERQEGVYNELGLQLRNKTPKRRVKAKLRDDRQPATQPNETWAMDFVHDQLASVGSCREFAAAAPEWGAVVTGLKHALREEELRLLAILRQRARHPPKELVQSGDSAGAKVSDVLCRPSAPKRPPASPPIAQLSLFAEEANLARVNHETKAPIGHSDAQGSCRWLHGGRAGFFNHVYTTKRNPITHQEHTQDAMIARYNSVLLCRGNSMGLDCRTASSVAVSDIIMETT